MKRLLLLTYYFPPAAGGGIARTLSFARHLPKHGWDVTVVCADAGSAPLQDSGRLADLPQAVRVIRVPAPAWARRGRSAVVGSGKARPSKVYRWARAFAELIWLPDSFAPWRSAAAGAVRNCLASEKFDLLLSSSPPDTVHLAALDAIADGNLPWVADFRDPWTGLAYKKPPSSWHAKRQREMRDSVLSRADMVLATTGALAEELGKQLPDGVARRIETLPNGWEDDVPHPQSEREVDPDRIKLVYTGTLWDVPATKLCLQAMASALSDRGTGRRLTLEIIGPHESGEREFAERLGLADEVRFCGQVPYRQARQHQSEADVLLLLQVHGAGYEVAVPGKLYEYLASGRPILAFLKEGEAATLVQRSGGWVVDPEDMAGARKAFERLLVGELPGGTSHERSLLVDEYRRDRIAMRLSVLLDSLLKQTQDPSEKTS